MSNEMSTRLRILNRADARQLSAMLDMFGTAFDEVETYTHKKPSVTYLENLLSQNQFIAIAALDGETVVGGLTAYELTKFEQERSEIYIYDLAVAKSHRRRGVATALIEELRKVAAEKNAYVVFVQADQGDNAAIALYTKLGTREDVLHFDFPIAAAK